MGDSTTTPTSGYLRYLPAVLQEGPFIEPFLLGFEAILTGYVPPPDGMDNTAGLEQRLDTIADYFDPQVAPADFLPWLAQWVALSLREDWSEQTRRNLIASVVPLYHLRGTKAGIQSALELCLSKRDKVTIIEPGTPAHYFQVQLVVTTRDDGESLASTIRMIESVVDQQKPAHTFYSLLISYPAMQIIDHPSDPNDKAQGIYVGVSDSTTLGSTTPESPSS